MHGAPTSHLLALLLADVGAGTLLRCLLIAVVVVTPYGLYQRAKVRKMKAEGAAARGELPPEPAPPDPAALESVVAEVEDLGRTLDDGTIAEVALPAAPTIDGRPAPAVVVDTVLQDALRRSGLTVVERRDDRLVVRPAAATATG
jgi:hypothetical protein